MKMRSSSLLVATLGLFVLGAGCGTNDPYSLLQQNSSNLLPPLNLPVTSGTTYQVRGFGTNGVDGFQFYSFGAYAANQTVIAPAAGLVTFVDPNFTPGFYAVTIYHSAELSTRTSGLQTASILAGAFVNQGDTIGTMPVTYSTAAIQMDVYVNGGPATCPLSYLSSTARQTFQLAQFGGQFPCVQ